MPLLVPVLRHINLAPKPLSIRFILILSSHLWHRLPSSLLVRNEMNILVNAIHTHCWHESWVSLMGERGQWGMQNSRKRTWKTRVFHWNISSHSLFVVSFHWSRWQTVILPTGAGSQTCRAGVMLSFIIVHYAVWCRTQVSFQVTAVQLGASYRSRFLWRSRVCYSVWFPNLLYVVPSRARKTHFHTA
jgi:hypothetical protein